MDEDHSTLKRLLEKNLKLSEENNKIIKSIRRWIRFGRLTTLVYWIIIISVTAGAYYFIQPFFEPFLSGAQNVFSGIGNLAPGTGTGALDIPDIFGKIQGQ